MRFRSHIQRLAFSPDQGSGFGRKKPSTDRLGSKKEKRDQEIRRRYADGEAAKSIAADFGLTKVRIYQICKGVQRRGPEWLK